jgi:malate dehydrogenase (oxaloacetate-decarboxylating)
VNNSIGFPGILKGALMVRARKITDNMAIAAAHSLADFAEKRGIHIEDIVPNMDEADVFPVEAADVAMQAIADGVARVLLTREEAYEIARRDIQRSREMTTLLMDKEMIPKPDPAMLERALQWAIEQVE